MTSTLKTNDTVVTSAKEIIQERTLFSRLIAVFGFASSSKDSTGTKVIMSTKESPTRSSSVTSKDGHRTSSSANRTRSFSTLSHDSQSYDTRSQSSRSSHRSQSSRSQSSRSSSRACEPGPQISPSPRSQSSKSSPLSSSNEIQSQSSSRSSSSHSRDRSHPSSRSYKGKEPKQRSYRARNGHNLESFLMPMLEIRKANTIERCSKTSPREQHKQQYDSFLSRKSTGRTELTSVDEETEVTSFSTMSNSSDDSSPLSISQ